MISVIVPVYNVAQYLSKCIDSILDQTYSDIELILVDDGSTDDSGNICDRYSQNDPRVTVIHQENSGVASARNKGTLAAKGEFLSYVDSDDAVDRNYLKCLYDGLRENNADISVCQHICASDFSGMHHLGTENAFSLITGKQACDEIVNLHITNMIVIWGKLYKRELRDYLIMPEGKAFEDEFTCYKVMYSATTVAQTKAPLYYYRQREGSLSNASFSEKNFDKLEALLGAAEWLEEKGDQELSTHAKKRYLLTIEIVWCKAFFGKAEKQVLHDLKIKHKVYYKQNKAGIKACCTMLEKITLFIFKISPKAYSIIADKYQKTVANNR